MSICKSVELKGLELFHHGQSTSAQSELHKDMVCQVVEELKWPAHTDLNPTEYHPDELEHLLHSLISQILKWLIGHKTPQ